jgi:integrase
MDAMAPTLPPGIDRLASGKYRARASYRGARETRTFATLAAAVRWRADALDALHAGETPPGPPPMPIPAPAAATLEDVARAFGEAVNAGTVRNRDGVLYKPSTLRRMESVMRLHVLPLIGAVPAEDLTREHVQELVDTIAASASTETAKKARDHLAAIMRYAARSRIVERSPVDHIIAPRRDHQERTIRVLSPAEASRMLHAASRDDAARERSFAAPLFGLALATGLRLGELLALRWAPHPDDDGGLDLDTPMVRVRWSLDRQRDPVTREIRVGPPKTRAGARDVPLGADDTAVMRRHLLATGRPPAGSLVFSDDGRPILGGGDPWRTWRRLATMAEVYPLPPVHATRHTWCVFGLRAGIRPEALAKLGGWSDVGIIYRRYGRHALPDELAGAAAALAAWRAQQGA